MPPLSHQERFALAQRMTAAIPHSTALGLTIVDIGEGMALTMIPFAPHLVGDPETGVLHGGVVTTLLDSTCGTAVMTHPSVPGGTATIDLRIDYMRPAAAGEDVFARATCFRVTRNVAFVRAVAFTSDEERPVATASGAFTVEGQGKIGALA
jgi:uncharacterized protein (TIGR00369 family)